MLGYRAPGTGPPRRVALRTASLVFLIPIIALRCVAVWMLWYAWLHGGAETLEAAVVSLPLLAIQVTDMVIAWHLSFGWHALADWEWRDAMIISLPGNLLSFGCLASASASLGPGFIVPAAALLPLAYLPCAIATFVTADRDRASRRGLKEASRENQQLDSR